MTALTTSPAIAKNLSKTKQFRSGLVLTAAKGFAYGDVPCVSCGGSGFVTTNFFPKLSAWHNTGKCRICSGSGLLRGELVNEDGTLIPEEEDGSDDDYEFDIDDDCEVA